MHTRKCQANADTNLDADGIHITIHFSVEDIIKLLRPNKKISVFRVTGLKYLSRVGTHIFF